MAWEREGSAQIEGLWADRAVGLDGVCSVIAMMRTPDGHSRLELTQYHSPAAIGAGPPNPPANTLGLHRVMFAVDNIDDTVARLRPHGAELLGEVAQYEDSYRLCYLHGRGHHPRPGRTDELTAPLARNLRPTKAIRLMDRERQPEE